MLQTPRHSRANIKRARKSKKRRTLRPFPSTTSLPPPPGKPSALISKGPPSSPNQQTLHHPQIDSKPQSTFSPAFPPQEPRRQTRRSVEYILVTKIRANHPPFSPTRWPSCSPLPLTKLTPSPSTAEVACTGRQHDEPVYPR